MQDTNYPVPGDPTNGEPREQQPADFRMQPGEGGQFHRPPDPEQEPRAEPRSGQPITCYCRVCGRGLAAQEARNFQGAIYCGQHAPQASYGPAQAAYGPAQAPPPPPGMAYEPPSPYATGVAPVTGASPGLAFLLGLIPGVGAVYNAQYVKAIVHVVVFGLLISIVDSNAVNGLEPLFALLIAIWYFHMPFEAYHTARKRSLGIPVDDFSSILPLKARTSGFPMGPVVLIGLGVVFLLAQFELLSVRAILQFWPVALIAAGAWMLYERIAQKPSES